jgi:hypothetical protein
MAAVTSTAREQIARLLGDIGDGSFSARRTSATADDLVLAIKGVGPLRLPIPREQARLLLAKAQPARYGWREQTLLDLQVRNTGEIPARWVKIDRRRWNRTLQPMLAALSADLGLAPGQRLAAKLHSLLIYGPRQFFKKHQDSERADGMVGTLVVTLPSTFKGGAIVVEHQGEVVSYRATRQLLSLPSLCWTRPTWRCRCKCCKSSSFRPRGRPAPIASATPRLPPLSRLSCASPFRIRPPAVMREAIAICEGPPDPASERPSLIAGLARGPNAGKPSQAVPDQRNLTAHRRERFSCPQRRRQAPTVHPAWRHSAQVSKLDNRRNSRGSPNGRCLPDRF